MPPLIQMQQEGKNMQDVRNSLGIKSIRAKIEKRTLERIGHIMRVEDNRMVKAATLGWLEDLENWPKTPGKKRKTVLYWKGLLKEAALDYTEVGKLSENRKEWKATVKERMKHMEAWEKNGGKENVQNRGDRRSPTHEETSLICQYEGCGKVCKSKAGLVNHTKRIHEKSSQRKTFKCDSCQEVFQHEANLVNHSKICTGTRALDDDCRKCDICNKEIRKSNFSRHYKTHNRQAAEQEPTIEGEKKPCDLCGILKSVANMARHKRICPGGGGAVL